MFRSDSPKSNHDQRCFKCSDYEKDDLVSLNEDSLSENTNNDTFED